LALKGRLLHAKSCGTRGRGTCAESFAPYHISEVARDLLAFLEKELAKRIRTHLQAGQAPRLGATLKQRPVDP
jgi:hypothetical protein